MLENSTINDSLADRVAGELLSRNNAKTSID